MTDIKHRISNVGAWAAFSISPSLVLLIILLGLNGIRLLNLETMPDSCINCRTITWEDILDSQYLRSNDIEIGDWVNMDTNSIHRAEPAWTRDSRNFVEGILNFLYEDDFFLFHSLGCTLIYVLNYILVGSPRLLPWHKYRDKRRFSS